MECHNHTPDIVYRKICVGYAFEVPRSKWDTPARVVENDQPKIPWDFQIQTNKLVMANQPDIVMADKQAGSRKTAVVIDVGIPKDSNIRNKEYEQLEKYPGQREELEKIWKMKVRVVPQGSDPQTQRVATAYPRKDI